MTAIVLAGGKKSLLNELYPDLPPALVPLAEKPFLYWLTQWIKQQAFNQIVYGAGIHFDTISAWANQQALLDADYCFDVFGETRPLGTAGATLQAAKRFPSEVFLVVNGDSLVLTDITPYLEKLKETPELDGMLIGANLNNAGRFGSLLVNEQGILEAFKEKQPSKALCNTGVYLLKQPLLEKLPSDKELSLEYDCFPKWIEQGKRFEVIPFDGPFIDIGSPESLSKVRETMVPFLKTLHAEPV